MIRGIASLCCALWAGSVWAIDLTMPARTQLVSDRGSAFAGYDFPIGPWVQGAVATEYVEGRVDRQSWRVNSTSITTLQILDPLRTELSTLGYETVFSCAARSCGGFDFRFAIEVIPAPDMYVDIRDFHFLAARRDDVVLSLLVSRGRTAGYIQVIQVSPIDAAPVTAPPPERNPEQTSVTQEPGSDPAPQQKQLFADQLISEGFVILQDLQFETGTSDLSTADYASLRHLSEFMSDNPGAQIALVGHTDATGALDVNISLSKRRAQSVATRLQEEHGVAADRMQAEGMGYLSPVASNLTPEGQEANRRVEVILLSLEDAD